MMDVQVERKLALVRALKIRRKINALICMTIVFFGHSMCKAALYKYIELPNGPKKCLAAFQNYPLPINVVHSSHNTVESEKIDRKVFDKYLRTPGPNGQEMAALYVEGFPPVYGSLKAVERMRPDLGNVRDILFDASLIAGEDRVTFLPKGSEESELTKENGVVNINTPANSKVGKVSIELAPILAGSALRTKNFVDLDAEVLVIANSKKIHPDDLYDPKSAVIDAYARFFLAQIQEKESQGYVFVDFKCGELDHVPERAESTKSRSIKWTLDELKAGRKMIPVKAKGFQLEELTLKQAIASQSRIKVDFIAKIGNFPEIQQITGLENRHIEITLMYVLGVQKGTGQPVLKINKETIFPEFLSTGPNLAIKNTASHLPVRVVASFFDPRHMELARKVSLAVRPPDLTYLNNVMLNTAMAHYRNRNYLKVLKILVSRFNYWNDFEYFAHQSKADESEQSSRSISDYINNILNDPIVVALSYFVEEAKNLASLKEINIENVQAQNDLERIVNEFLIKHKRVDGNHSFSSMLDLADFVKAKLNAYVLAKIHENDSLTRYIHSTMDAKYANEYQAFSEDPMFVSFSLPKKFVDAYRSLYTVWVERYPNIHFTHPDEIHMTAHFVGRFPLNSQNQLYDAVDRLNRKLQKYPFKLTEGGLSFIGRKQNLIALIFDSETVPPEVIEGIMDFKNSLHDIGIRPDFFGIKNFLPHITVAQVNDAKKSEIGNIEIYRLFFEDYQQLENVMLNGNVLPYLVSPEVVLKPKNGRYSLYEEIIDGDFKEVNESMLDDFNL